MADVKFIANTVSEILRDCSPENIKIIIGNANKYATVLKFPKDKSIWNDKQVDRYLTFIEKSSTLPDLSDEEDVVVRIQTIMGEVTDITNGKPEEQKPDGPLVGTVEKVVENLKERKQYRDDLKCPCPNNRMVFDNRNNKKSVRSPDFVCSGKSLDECPMHTGKWRKSWWLDNSDIPEDWKLSANEPL